MFPQNTHLTICPSSCHINHGSHSFVSFLCLSISARCCTGNMNACNKEYEGDRQCSYAIHINNNTIRKESQSPFHEVLARSCWRAGPGQEASDGSKVRREGKAGPFISCEVQVQIGPTWATTPAGGRRRRRATRSVGAQTTQSSLGRQRLHPGENFCVRAATSLPQRQRMRPGDDVCCVRS